MAASAMLVLTLLVEFAAVPIIRIFSNDPAAIAVGAEYLHIIAWNFVASGVIFVSSSMFQAMGNTLPSFAASFTRVVLVTIPVLLLTRLSGFNLRWVWYISVFSVTVQLLMVLLLLRREFRVRLTMEPLPDVHRAAGF
jgi:Na+-driven multidrug efflux pump